MKKILMLTAAVFALQSLPAMAQDGATKDGKKHDFFAKVDANKDGVISKDEFLKSSQERAEKKFSQMDANGDGKVTKEESKAHHDAMKEKWKDRKAAHGHSSKGDVPAPAKD